MRLRDYQSQAESAVHEAFGEHRAVLMVMATGLGKTVVFSHIAKPFLERGSRVLVLAHREELIYQARDKLRMITGHVPEIEMAERYSYEAGYFGDPARIVVSSIQTQNSGRKDKRRMHRFKPDQFGLVVIDEAHHSTADSYVSVLGYYMQNPSLRVLGVTATPHRADGSPLGRIFKHCAFNFGISNGIDNGWLVPITQQYVVCRSLDFSRIRTTAQDLNSGELAAELERERPMHEMCGPTIDIVGSLKTIFFCASVAQAERVSEIFNRHKPGMSRTIFGTTPRDERRQIMSAYRAGDFQILVNVGVATEGFDDPDIQAVVVGRPTKSRTLYCQMIGRGTRPLTGLVDPLELAEERKAAIAKSEKPRLLVLDFAGNSGSHRLISTADVLGELIDDDIADAARAIMMRSGKESSVAQAIQKATFDKRILPKLLDAQRRAKIIAQSRYEAREVNPFGENENEPQRSKSVPKYWYFRPATPAQVNLLRRRGYKTDGLTINDASALIDQIAKREGWGSRK